MKVENENIIYPETMSENAKDFIDKLIRKNPAERIKASEALQHPFLLNVDQDWSPPEDLYIGVLFSMLTRYQPSDRY